jgi:predicted outer membrane repeat protein
MTFENTVFTNNTAADGSGGAIISNLGSLTCYNVDFSNNVAGVRLCNFENK